MSTDQRSAWAVTKRSYLGVFRRFLPYIRPFRLAVAVIVAIDVGQIGLGLIEPWMTKLLIDNGFNHQPLPEWFKRIFWFASGSGIRIVLFTVIGGLFLRVFRHAVDFMLDYNVKVRIRNGINFTFATDMFNHLQRLSFSYHDRTTVGDSLFRVNNDTGFVSDMVYSNPRYRFTS